MFADRKRLFRLGIRQKIIFLVCGLTGLTAIVISVIMLDSIRDISIDRSAAEFIGNTELMATTFSEQFQQIENDSFLLSRTPPFLGLARSLNNDGYDYEGFSSTELWVRRLQTIFRSTLEERPYYTQLRYILLQDNGRELVRVDQDETGIYNVEQSRLQQKGDEFYFQAALDLPPGLLYYSNVTRNRELGVEAPNAPPTVRILQTIVDQNDRPFGFLVINVNYEALFRDILDRINPRYDSFIVDSFGNFAQYDRAAQTTEFRLAEETTEPPPEIRIIQSQTARAAVFQENINAAEEFGYIISFPLGSREDSMELTLAQFAPSSEVFSQVSSVLSRGVVISTSLIIISFLLATALAYYLTAPIKRIRNEVLAYGLGKQKLSLPVTLSDELGDLARTFEQVTTELAIAEKEQKDALLQLQAAIHNAVDGLVMTDSEGIITSINPSGENIFSVRQNHLTGSSVTALIPDIKLGTDTPLYRHDDNLPRTGFSPVVEIEGVNSRGERIPLEISISQIELLTRKLFWIVVRNITERKQQENKLLLTMEELRYINNQLDDFTYIASHDLREPMRGVQIHSESLIKKYADALEPEARHKLSRINQLSGRMQQLVADLLEISRLGRSETKAFEVSINKLVRDVKSALESLLEETNTTLIINPGLPVIKCDQTKILSLFMNLITNGIKYNENRDKQVEIGCLDECFHDGKLLHTVFFVRDNGIGIEEIFYDDIFKLFKRLNSEKAYGYGTGAGLTFVKKIVDQHRGQIWLESAITKGTTFYFTLGAQ